MVTPRRRQRIARIEAKRPRHEPQVIVTPVAGDPQSLDELADVVQALLDRVRRSGGG